MMVVMFMVISAVMVVINCQAEKESEVDITKKLSSCWLMSVKEISNSQLKMTEIMNYTASMGVTNRTQVYYKVQMDMIGRCFAEISVENADKVLKSLNEVKTAGPVIQEIVADFTYDHFFDPELNYELDELDKTLLKIVKSLEDELMAYKNDKDVQDSKDQKKLLDKRIAEAKKKDAVNLLRDKLEEQTAKRTINPTKIPKPIPQPAEQPSSSQYFIFAGIIGVLVAGAILALRKINQIDSSDKKSKIKKTKKE